MTCFMCKGHLEDKETTFMVDLSNCIIIIKNAPSQVCTQCGAVSYNHEVTRQLESIVNSLRANVTEIAVVRYSSKVA